MSNYKPLPRFLICYNREELPAPMVLCTREPYIWGKVWRMKSNYEFADFVASYKGLGIATIPGYNIAITFGGVMTGTNMRTSNPDVLGTISKTLEGMTAFYQQERIEDKPGFNKKFRIT